MKRWLLFVFLFLSFSVSAQNVYVCTGTYAKAYHKYINCAGLNNCQSVIVEVNEYDAINDYWKVPCCRCYPGSIGCKDDYKGQVYNNSAPDGGALLIVGAAFATAGIFIISNDVYFLPTYSFQDISESYDHPVLKNSTGWSFGLRKTFDYSAIEYGATFLKYSYRNSGSPIERYKRTWIYKAGFVREIFFNRTGDNLRVYTGITANYIQKVGIGGILGLNMIASDRIRIDLRYELTSQTNQFHIGLIFKYQKEYFWEKHHQKSDDDEL